jgi:hypothetical protein
VKTGTCELSQLASVGLGYKSLQNNFFYVTEKVVKEFDIERVYLRPIVRMVDLNGQAFLQNGKVSRQLFYCSQSETDLRGTGALRYLRAMADRPAVAKKQSRTTAGKTIREVLDAQGGKKWYAPKAQTHRYHIWVRKAFDAVFSPFLFEREAVLDQRCNFLQPRTGVEWKCLGALLTSSIFAVAAESFGGASLGAGALEIPTKKLRQVPVPDIREMSKAEKLRLVSLAEAAWGQDVPVDWRIKDKPGHFIEKLDQFLLEWMATPLTTVRLYADIVNVCRSRLRLGADKETKTKKSVREDVDGYGRQIADSVRPFLEGKQFPEAFFVASDPYVTFDLSDETSLIVSAVPMMAETAVSIRNRKNDLALLDKVYPRPVAQVILRSLLMGRRKFNVPNDPQSATRVLKAYFEWFPTVLAKIEKGSRSAAFGTKYEEQVLNITMKILGLHPDLFKPDLFGEFHI